MILPCEGISEEVVGVKLQYLILSYFLIWMLGSSVSTAEKPVIAASIPPQSWILEKIAGSSFEVLTILPAGSSPHAFSIQPGTRAKLSQSKLWFRIGTGFEQAIVPALLSEGKVQIINQFKSVERIPLVTHGPGGAELHQHEDGAFCSQCAAAGEPDPHIWLSLRNLRTMAHEMKVVLLANLPMEGTKTNENILKNWEDLDLELEQMDQDITRRLASVNERRILVFHPAWGYFCHDYNFEQVAIEPQGKKAGTETLRELIDFCRSTGLKTLFVQPEYGKRWAAAIAREIEGTVITLDPLAASPEDRLMPLVRALESDPHE